MKNKLFRHLLGLLHQLRERVTPSQDSPVSSCCLTLQRINQSLRKGWCKVSHRFATTGAKLLNFKFDRVKKIWIIWRKSKKDDTKNLGRSELSRLKSLKMLTLERKIIEVGEYLSRIEEDLPAKIDNNKYFLVKIKSIIDDKNKDFNQKLALLAEMINNLSDCLEKNWNSFPEEVFQLFEEIFLKINETKNDNDLTSLTEVNNEATESITALSQSLEKLKIVLDDIAQFIEINKFIKDKRTQTTNLAIKEQAKEIIKKAKNSEENSQSIKKQLSDYLKDRL